MCIRDRYQRRVRGQNPEGMDSAEQDNNVVVELHGVRGANGCVYFEDYPHLFMVKDTNSLNGYINENTDSTTVLCTGGMGHVEVHDVAVPVRTRAAYVGRSGPRQDLHLLRKLLDVERSTALKEQKLRSEVANERAAMKDEIDSMIRRQAREKAESVAAAREAFAADIDRARNQVAELQHELKMRVSEIESMNSVHEQALQAAVRAKEMEMNTLLDELKASSLAQRQVLAEEIAKLKANWPAPVDYGKIEREKQAAIAEAVRKMSEATAKRGEAAKQQVKEAIQQAAMKSVAAACADVDRILA
eukprot:TRINITY_DN9685_c0_g1_i1.p1 TRINITY_DN9685_c0_g1~~TRINITY_DN9685_c0_g1_i1.p1  ORF type:complete len:303 (+),score=107.15 TRINITY_DN9685_c0_g1_i1:110-1018(+)